MPADLRAVKPINECVDLFARLLRRLKPADRLIVQTEPAVLVADEAAGVPLDATDHFIQVNLPLEVLLELSVAQAGHGRQVPTVALGNQPLHLLYQPLGHHPLHPLINAAVELSAGHGQPNLQDTIGRGLLALPVGDGPPGRFVDLQGADHPPHVARVHPGRRLGIHILQPGVESLVALLRRLAVEPLPQLGVRRHAGDGPALDDRFDVQTRTSYQ